MEIPSSMFVPLGVIMAATLTGVFSFVSLINQKEGKISEFRQNWIDALRDDIAKLTSSFDRISSSWQLIDIQENKKANAFDGSDWMMQFNELAKEDISTFTECYNRIMMRLNVTDDKKLIEKIKVAKKTLSEPQDMFDKKIVSELIAQIIELSQQLLKDEWEVVKAGEKAYKNTKKATLFIIFTLFLGLSLYVYKQNLFLWK